MLCYWEIYPLFADGQSQWPHDLRHEQFLYTQTLGLWFQIQLEARMFHTFNLCLCCPV
jgi:hypothetical protein